MPKQLILLFGLLISMNCFSQEISDFASAWSYLIAPSKSENWVVISSKSNDGFLQCSHVADFIRCSVPIWTKEIPSESTTVLYIDEADKPHPEIKGAVADYQFDAAKENLAKEILKKYHLEFDYVYSVITDENKNKIGTSCALDFYIELNSKNFEVFAKDYLKSLFGYSNKDIYLFEAGQFDSK